MKLSKHTVFYPRPGRGPGAGNDFLAYNTRTQGILGINKEVREFIEKVTSLHDAPSPFPSPSRGEGRERVLGDEEQSCLNTLLDSGILIDNEVDEDKVLEHWFSEIKFRPRPLHATILTTFKCNFACTYCFESAINRTATGSGRIYPTNSGGAGTGSGRIYPTSSGGATMDEQTAEQVIAYLKHKAEEKNSQKVRLNFYGGEPLMNPGAVLRIARGLCQWADERGIKFSFGMVTNGSLVRKDLMSQLAGYGLRNIRITLDGDREVHNRRRPFLDGRGSFDNIIANITSVIDSVKVELGANFDRDNIAGLHRLLDYLEEKKLNKRISRVLFAPVVSRLGGDENLTVEPVGCHSLSGELAEEGIKLEKELIQRGYNTASSVKVSACPMLMDDSMLVIDPSGDLYKCEAFAGREQFCIGNVRTNRFNHRYYEFVTMKPWQGRECLECPYVPMCGGGCRYIAQLKHSDYTRPACDKEYYEKIFPQLLKMDYERGVL